MIRSVLATSLATRVAAGAATAAPPPDLSCYTPAEARRLDRALQASQTLRGRIEPVGRSTLVCGFVEQTSAVCWQYSATLHSFVRVGDWLT